MVCPKIECSLRPNPWWLIVCLIVWQPLPRIIVKLFNVWVLFDVAPERLEETRAESGHAILSQRERFNTDVECLKLVLIIQSVFHVRRFEVHVLYVSKTLFAF